jgi:hypothetical protein
MSVGTSNDSSENFRSTEFKPNPYPGNNPTYIRCHDCKGLGWREYQNIKDEDCELCSGLGWVAS